MFLEFLVYKEMIVGEEKIVSFKINAGYKNDPFDVYFRIDWIFSVQTGLPSFELVFIRCICATLFLTLCWFATGQYKNEKWNKRNCANISVWRISRF